MDLLFKGVRVYLKIPKIHKFTFINFVYKHHIQTIINFNYLFRIVADNFDLSIKSRIQTKTNTNQSVHWTHQYAIKDRVCCDPLINDEGPQMPIDDLRTHQLLPTKAVQDLFKSDSIVLVSRIITRFLAPFSQFKGVVVKHIPHIFSEEMAKKSERVRM